MTNNLGAPRRDFHAFEFAAVCFLGFGLFVISSVVGIASYRADQPVVAFTDGHLWTLLAFEVIFGGAIAVILRARGWRWSDFHFGYTHRGTWEGFFLAAAMIALAFLVERFVGEVNVTAPTASAAAILVVSIVNPLYEELLVCAYIVEALRKRFGLTVAFNVSIALRVSYHLYQGPTTILFFTLLSLAFTFMFIRTGRLWPLVVAHALIDFIGLTGFEI